MLRMYGNISGILGVSVGKQMQMERLVCQTAHTDWKCLKRRKKKVEIEKG
jgi:hypothetical protein